MPNKISPHKKSVTISISKLLVEKIDSVAKLTNRSRTFVIEQLIRFHICNNNNSQEPDKSVMEIVNDKYNGKKTKIKKS